MRFYTACTLPFSELFYDFFLLSKPEDMQLTTIIAPQQFNDVHCARLDWAKWITKRNLDIVIAEKGNCIGICGVDMLFHGDPIPILENELETADFLASSDGGHLCYDFKVMRCTASVIELFAEIHFRVGQYKSDQTCLNRLIKETTIKCRTLPYRQFWNVCKTLPPGRRDMRKESTIPPPVEGLWDTDLPIPLPPRELVMFHANYCEGGLSNKIKLLTGIRDHLVAGRYDDASVLTATQG